MHPWLFSSALESSCRQRGPVTRGVRDSMKLWHTKLLGPLLRKSVVLRGTLVWTFPQAIGTIDCTPTPAPRQYEEYSGHRRQYVRASPTCLVIHGLHSARHGEQAGGRHDSYRRRPVRSSRPAGGVRRDSFSGDDAYEGMPRIRVPAGASAIADANERETYSDEHKRKRSRIEQFFSVLKQWWLLADGNAQIDSFWRRVFWLLAFCITAENNSTFERVSWCSMVFL